MPAGASAGHHVTGAATPYDFLGSTTAMSTTRVFTAAEQASNDCQLGNIGAVSRLIDSWLDSTAGSLVDGDAAARTPTPM